MKNLRLTKKQTSSMVLKAIAHNAAFGIATDDVILKPTWDEDGSVRFWLNSHHVDKLFLAAKAFEATAIIYAHYEAKKMDEITGKEPKDKFYQYLYVGLI